MRYSLKEPDLPGTASVEVGQALNDLRPVEGDRMDDRQYSIIIFRQHRNNEEKKEGNNLSMDFKKSKCITMLRYRPEKSSKELTQRSEG